jgi:dolichyl-phosphate beta-glucosyltransferase
MSGIEIVVPCYNEARRLRPQAFLAFAAAERDVRLLFVDDGSTDATAEVLESIRERAPHNVDWIGGQPNAGKGEAVRRGLRRACARPGARFVGFWDADLSTPLELVPRFAEVLDRRPAVRAVIGSRMKLCGRRIDRDWYRCLLSSLFARTASLALGCRVRDTQCGAKLLRVDADLLGLLAEPFRSRWIFDVELLQRLSLSGDSPLHEAVFELPLEEWTEVGDSRLRPRDFARAVRELGGIALAGLRQRGGRGTRAAEPIVLPFDPAPRPIAERVSTAYERRSA